MAKQNMDNRQEILKDIIKRLHEGVPFNKLKKEFSRLLKNTSAEEIADMENALIKEGFPAEEIQKLCNVHAEVFKQSLKRSGKSNKLPGHPIYTFIEENKRAKIILKALKKAAKKLKGESPKPAIIDTFMEQFNLLREIEKHYQRKEYQLFPMLEEKKFTGPTQVMWGKHDEIREMIKAIATSIEKKSWREILGQVKTLSFSIKKLIFLEEKILYPTSLKKLDEREWAKIKLGEHEIGYAWVKPANIWDANLAKAISFPTPQQTNQQKPTTEPENVETIQLSQGKLTVEQINLMLGNLPLDITYVDENDRVCYYSDTKDRIFPRSPAIIGRTVQNCHPPKSVHVVNEIVKSFKEKKKEVAEFWIQFQSKFIHIRYFPLFDDSGKYRGVIEVSQEITDIKNLSGERRLLD